MDDRTTELVGERIRSLRAERAISLSALAAAAGIGKGSLSELEHGARNPTLATLYAVAGALQVPLSALLAERVGAEVASDGVSARLLDTRHHDGTTEVYALHLDAGAHRRSPGHGPGVVEHLLVTRGAVRAGRTGQEVDVEVGGHTTWVSDGPHGYDALGGSPADAVLVIRSPAPGAGSPR
ncbi:helix-turn-helix domain-containing protein [Oerskovia flava]|uniref:helix-turn-helix domain-containing protein n=1 Tax=Oerskovia flava TaxID=2986422 RepID=UPI0022407185|nr:helix-turn-helix transcriptional regulator [Oerskovia sp. JB1-3-2]